MSFIFPRLSSRRERYIFYIALVSILAVFFDRVVVQQVMSRLDKLNKEIYVQEKKLQRSLRILAQKDLITAEYGRYVESLKQIYSDEEEKSRLLSDIEKIAGKSGVFLVNVKPGPIEKAGGYKRYTVDIRVESEISFLADFIYQLEQSSRLLRVRDFRLTLKEEGSAVLKAKLTVTELLISSKKSPSTENGGSVAVR